MIVSYLSYINAESFLVLFFVNRFFIRDDYEYLQSITCKSFYVKLHKREILCAHS